MANPPNTLKQKLEHLFDMGGGYVLDFSNASFADFVETSLGFNPYTKYSGSKAVILRRLWFDLSDADFRKLALEMLDRWRTNVLVSGREITDSEERLFNETSQAVKAFASHDSVPAADLRFLKKDFGTIDLAQIDVPVSYQEVVAQRLDEIERCLKAEAPLAVVFLCGSTLEGLLSEVANKNPEAYNRAKAAPRSSGAVKSLGEWTLDNLITVSRELGVVGEDVVKHAHAVKDFRNYIHPRQQVKDNFKPRMFTATMANQVLLAAITDLSDRTSRK